MTQARDSQCNKFDGLIASALTRVTGYAAGDLDVLRKLSEEELCMADPQDTALQQGGDMPLMLGTAAKAVRLGGEFPYYLAKVVALVLLSDGQSADKELSRERIKQACGLPQEAEFIWMVRDAASMLPDLELSGSRYERASLMRKAYRQGYHYEKVCRGCAQCCMAGVSDVTGKENLEMFRAANGFAAGVGLLGDGICGGYSGGVLSIGMFAGRRKEFFDGDRAEKDLSAKLVKLLHDKFIETFDTVICHDIHRVIFGRAFHITRPDDKVAFEEAGAHKQDKCPAVVAMAAAWTIGILYDEGFLDEARANA